MRNKVDFAGEDYMGVEDRPHRRYSVPRRLLTRLITYGEARVIILHLLYYVMSRGPISTNAKVDEIHCFACISDGVEVQLVVLWMFRTSSET